jgi:hypothetical protein
MTRRSRWLTEERICADCFAAWFDDPDRTREEIARVVRRRHAVADLIRVALWLLLGFLVAWLVDRLISAEERPQ